MKASMTMDSGIGVDAAGRDLLARVGGHTWIAQVTREFYRMMGADPEIAWALCEADVPALERRQVAFFVEALGGTPVSSGDDEVLDLSPPLFARAVGHLGDALVARGMPDDLLNDVVAAVVLHATR
jgi:truncated hemoglobin YjbI